MNRQLSLLLVVAFAAISGYLWLTNGAGDRSAAIVGADARMTESSGAADLLLESEFDPALNVVYSAHPAEFEEVLSEFDVDADGILQWQASERSVTPAIVAKAIKHGSRDPALPGAQSDNDYSFPALEDGPDGVTLVINDEPIPGRSSRRLLQAGTGAWVSNGDTVALQYDMFSWSTGERVESSMDALGGPLTVRLGASDSPLPAAVDKALRDRHLGSRVQIVLAQGTSDLPDHLNPNDGYVLIADLQAATGAEPPASQWPQEQAAAAAARQAFGGD